MIAKITIIENTEFRENANKERQEFFEVINKHHIVLQYFILQKNYEFVASSTLETCK